MTRILRGARPDPAQISGQEFGGAVVLREPASWSLERLAELAAPPLRRAGAERAIAFGSFARRAADAWSDLDLVVVIPTDLGRFERGPLVEGLLDALPVAVDVLIYTPEEFQRGVSGGYDVFAAIAIEGRQIYPLPDQA